MFPSPTKSCPFVLLLLFCLLLSFSFPGNSLLDAASQPSPPPSASSPSAGFWISVELLSVDFRKGCISTALCHQPAFKLTQLMTLNGQSAVMNWPVEGTGPKTLLQKDIPRQFIAHWPLGDPEDVSIGCQIAGTDPSFGFARTCDETPPRRLFQEQLVRRILPKGLRRNGIDPSEGGDGGEGGENNDGDGGNSLLVQMNGRCFNATLAVQKHISRCPWCPDPNVDIQVVGGTAGTGQMSEQLTPKDDALQLQNALILALSGAVVFSLTALCCALGAHWRYRKRNNLTGRRSKGTTAPLMLGAGRKKRILKLVSPPRAQRSLPSISPMDEQHQRHHEREATAILYGQRGGEVGATMGAEEQRYDVPWDNKFCLVPRQWLLNQQQSLDSCASMAFSGGIEPLPMMAAGDGRNHPAVEYATCAEFCAVNSPPPPQMAARLPPPPPPSLPPFRHSQPMTVAPTHLPPPLSRQSQMQQCGATFSPNTSGNSNNSFGRHDDSGLDSV